MVSVTPASRYITSASRYHPRYQSRHSMYIRGLIPRNFAELAEAVPIGVYLCNKYQHFMCWSLSLSWQHHMHLQHKSAYTLKQTYKQAPNALRYKHVILKQFKSNLMSDFHILFPLIMRYFMQNESNLMLLEVGRTCYPSKIKS